MADNPVTLEWVGGPDDGARIVVPYPIRVLRVAIPHPLGWKDLRSSEPIVVRRVEYPVRNWRIYFYEGKVVE